MNKHFSLAVACVLVFAGAAAADEIEDRQALMKRNGDTMKILAPMAKGEAPYDQAAAMEGFQQFVDTADRLPDLFPESSQTGGDTEASPKIWEDQAGFETQIDAFREDSEAALAAAPADLASFQAAFGAVAENCGDCHETYRVEKEN
ncbi:cytochrome c [Rhizobium sp. EC-SD404]|uniref:c-type cytochrome n=1 Tax=Rhizobium sp. EC-SD404 TaxID=2038389 RepID=UPI00125A88D0|nr:cytochrome c [Rhizobium sp. EC-SD404]VVT08456.1 Cytochrome c' [Rhizobium sp. EC-SD404]